LRKLDIELNALKTQKHDTELQLTRIKESKSEVEKRNESLRREIDILTQDKTFLNRENTNLLDKVKRLEEKVDRTEQSLLDVKKQSEKYMDRVLSANDEVKGKFDLQYSKEIDDLKDRQAKELALAKQNLTDLYERKVEYLTERKDE
jgi:progesterone-induced-blocking factor 1